MAWFYVFAYVLNGWLLSQRGAWFPCPPPHSPSGAVAGPAASGKAVSTREGVGVEKANTSPALLGKEFHVADSLNGTQASPDQM